MNVVVKVLRSHGFEFTFIGILLCILGLYIAPIISTERAIPGSSQYGYPQPYLQDYFEYLSFIRDGQKGSLLGCQHYTEESLPCVVIHPLFTLLGVITKPFGISPAKAYNILHFISLILVVCAVYMLIKAVLQQTDARIVALLLFVSASEFWRPIMDNGIFRLDQPNTWSGDFNVFDKITMDPPHHLLIIVGVILTILYIAHNRWSTRMVFIGVVIGVVMGFIEPYITVILLIILAVNWILDTLLTRNLFSQSAKKSLCVLVGASPVIVYYMYYSMFIAESPLLTTTNIFSIPLPIPLINYILALGPLLILSIPVCFDMRYYINPIRRLLLLWATLPIILYFIPGIGIILFLRLFQTYQHIPLALLATLVLVDLVNKINKKTVTTGILIFLAAASVVYGAAAYILEFNWYTSLQQPYFYQYNLLIKSWPLFSYLNTHTPKMSVIVTSERLGQMIPSFTDDRVIIGQQGERGNYVLKRNDVYDFYNGNIPTDKIPDFLRKYHVSYIVFGLDAPAFTDSIYKDLPYFKIASQTDTYTLVRIVQQ